MIAVLTAGVIALIFLSLLWGPAGLDWHVVEVVRLPRVLGAVFAGVSLSIAGLLLQTATRNPLADPYVLGISGVSALTALSFYLAWRFLGVEYIGYVGGALLGAAAASALLLALAARATISTVVIAGVLLAFMSHSVLQLVLLLLPPDELGYVYLSLQGAFSAYPPGPLGYAAAALLLPLLITAWGYSRWVSAYIHGEEAAQGLGVSIKRVNLLITGLSATFTGLVVSLVGPVGFIGLMAPHLARWAVGSHRFDRVLGHTALFGILLALLADLAARALLPRDVPSGIVLSIIGVPFAIAIFWRYVR
ncbi:FecCD family ABC transporter permease [Pyrobaculum aerophilum]|uniref:Iron ABC transporter permease n=1 Tax=Pyrobaculum aerophilum TaxID=13773 RepID=A0A371QYT1_9CREN|nr:iron chelate uptake ABC transporter family permease subunit [Pyrobaculum aerophilum]RFA95978.1 iron ABC transporter permease [Pyrobaculum aerophilum]RFA99128.1 iron ABC transporter permease [Pyrobaculum aerophilum]